MLIKIDDGNVKDVAITEVNATNYIVPDNEKHVYHCKIEVRKFDQDTGARLSKPRIQKFGVKMFKQIASELKRQGYTVEILHNPTEYMEAEKARKAEEAAMAAERKAMAAERKAKEAEEKRAAEETARKAEIDAAVAAALAEQQKQHEADIEAAVAKAMAKAEKKAAKAEKKAKADESETNAE